MGLDTFVANAFIFIPNEPLLAVSLDNVGMIVIDLISQQIIEIVDFHDWVPGLPETFQIESFIPIHDRGIRVLFKKLGAFSFIWREIGRIGDEKSIFIGARTAILFIGVHNEITTPLIMPSPSLGVIQLVYYLTSNNFNVAFVRIYNFFNHVNSKVFREYRIGRVSN